MITQWHGNVTGGCIYAIPASKDNNCPADDDCKISVFRCSVYMYHLMTLSVTYFIFWLRDKWSWLEILDGVVSAPGETTAISTQI